MFSNPHLYKRSFGILLYLIISIGLSACDKVEHGEEKLELVDPFVGYRYYDSPGSVEKRVQQAEDRASGLIDEKGDVIGYDPLKDIERDNNDSYEVIQKTPKIWLPPLLVTASNESTQIGQRLPGNILLKVEVLIYPSINCNASDNSPSQRSRAYLAPITPEELSTYGQPVSSTNIWMVPTNTHEHEIVRLGPIWLGNALRLAGGHPVFFVSSQNCQTNIENAPDTIPTKVFRHSPYDNYSISARSPFTAKILEMCPIDSFIVKYEQRISTQFSYYQRGKITSVATLKANCPSSGIQTFVSEPNIGYFNPTRGD